MIVASARADESGVTLVELVVAIAITGILMAALSGALFFALSTTSDDRRGLSQSNAEQIVAFYLNADVQAACAPGGAATCSRSPNPEPSTASACGSTASSQFALDQLTDATATAASTTVLYALDGGALSRIVCPIGSSTPTSTTPLALNVTDMVAGYPLTGSCAGSFQVAVTIAPSGTGQGAHPYTFTLCARRRSV